jgi:23S rRNA pseudouridine1911/1915/1917 synthase
MLTEQDILFEDNHLLVFNKRAGIATMGVEPDEPSLINEAKTYIKHKYDKPGKVFLGVVSRIDKLVSGAIVFARTSKSASRLSEQFRNRTPEKIYWAIVESNPRRAGELNELHHQIDLLDWMYKDDDAMRMRCCANQADAEKFDAKKAALSFRPIGIDSDQRLLEIQLQTGRKHQIRCQLAKFGTPVLGDRKYGSVTQFHNSPARKGRNPHNGKGSSIALHSRILKIVHPTQKTALEFVAPVAKQWKIDRFGHNI